MSDSGIMGVLGVIASTELGLALPHEHLLADASSQWKPPADLSELTEYVQPFTVGMRGAVQTHPFAYRDIMQQNDLHIAVGELREFKYSGGSTVVDLGNSGYGRDPVGLRILAELTGVNIVMGCGEYVEHGHNPFVRHAPVDMIRDVILDELFIGAGKTGVRAGIIGEIGTGNPLTDDERKVVSAAARAQLQSGVALNLHRSIFPDEMAGLEAVDLALNTGVDPAKLIVSHCDERPEPEFALAVAERGAWVELDTFGMEQWAVSSQSGDTYPERSFDRDRMRILLTLLDHGYRDQILLSHDMAMKPQLIAHGGWGLTHITKTIVPQLVALGVDQEDIDAIRYRNPVRAICHPLDAGRPRADHLNPDHLNAESTEAL